MSIGWLVNDTLTCIPGTKTFWHDLLDGVPGLEDKTFGYTSFDVLAERIEREALLKGAPDYLVRNATFFRAMNLPCKTISLLQDLYTDGHRAEQIRVCNSSTVTVFNSPFVCGQYPEIRSCKKVIPIGIDFDLFVPIPDSERLRQQLGILPDSVLFVGSSLNYPKGFDLLLDVIDNSSMNFCLVMKDGYSTTNPRVKVFNSVPHSVLVKIYNACSVLLCTSRMETLHLAGIEAAACGLPIVASNVGVYYNRPPGAWGTVSENFVEDLQVVLSNKSQYNPRDYFLGEGFDKRQTIQRWGSMIKEVVA